MTRTTFEDRLLTELKQEVVLAVAEDRHSAPRRRRVLTPVRAGAGLVAAAAAAGAFLILPGGGATPAYAVEQGKDGEVLVRISDWPHGKEEVAKFADKLAEAGVATLFNPPEGYLCQPWDGKPGEGPSLSAPEPPPGADTRVHESFVGGAEAIGAQMVQAHGDPAPGVGQGHRQENADSSENSGGEDEFTYHLKTGDTAILSDAGGQESIAFVRGACAPLPGAAK